VAVWATTHSALRRLSPRFRSEVNREDKAGGAPIRLCSGGNSGDTHFDSPVQAVFRGPFGPGLGINVSVPVSSLAGRIRNAHCLSLPPSTEIDNLSLFLSHAQGLPGAFCVFADTFIVIPRRLLKIWPRDGAHVPEKGGRPLVLEPKKELKYPGAGHAADVWATIVRHRFNQGRVAVQCLPLAKGHGYQGQPQRVSRPQPYFRAGVCPQGAYRRLEVLVRGMSRTSQLGHRPRSFLRIGTT